MAIKMTREEYQAKYGTAPAIPDTTSPTQNQTSTSLTPIKMTRAEYQAKYGQAPVIQSETPTDMTEKKVGGIQSFIQDVARPFLKLPTTVASAGARVIGGLIGGSEGADKTRNTALEGIDYGYFGNVKPIGAEAFKKYQAGDIGGGEFTARAAGDLAGTAAEIASYAVGGEGTVGAAKAGLKGLVKEGFKEGVKTGVASGGLLSFGQSLQNAESTPMDVAYNTLFGASIGGAAGGVLGAAAPAAVKAANEAKKFLDVPSLEGKLANGYKSIFNPTARQIKADTRFGNDSFKFLAQEMPDLPVTVNSTGRVEADNAIEMAKLKYSAEASAYKPIIRNSGKYVDIDQVIKNAKASARKEFDGTDLIKAEQQIDNEVEAYLRNNPQDINVTPGGKRLVTLARADDIKSYSWARGKGWGTPEAEVWNDTNNIIGHSLKDAIEKELPSAPIKEMNRRLGQWKNAIDMLEKRNGQVSGSGGKLSKYITKSVGTTIGASLGGNDGSIGGGITGAGTGFLTATALASAMANPNVRLFVVRQMLNKLSKAGRKDMIQEAEQILKEQASKYLLPAAGKSSYVEQPIILPTSARETNLGINEVKNAKIKTEPVKPNLQLEAGGKNPIQLKGQSIPKPLAKIEPKQAPTIQANMKDNIDKTVPQKTNKVNDSGLKNVSGGIAGIEIKKDENGKTTVSFNEEKALAGIVGMVSAKKIKMVQELATKFIKRTPPYGLLKDLEAFTKYHDLGELPVSEKSADMFKKDIRTQLEKFGVDAFNMSDRQIADFSDAVIEKANKKPSAKK